MPARFVGAKHAAAGPILYHPKRRAKNYRPIGVSNAIVRIMERAMVKLVSPDQKAFQAGNSSSRTHSSCKITSHGRMSSRRGVSTLLRSGQCVPASAMGLYAPSDAIDGYSRGLQANGRNPVREQRVQSQGQLAHWRGVQTLRQTECHKEARYPPFCTYPRVHFEKSYVKKI